MAGQGLLDDLERAHHTDLMARIEELRHLYETQGLWKRFKEWVSKHCSGEDMLSCTKIRAKPVVEVTSCEPHIVAQAFTTLEEMCVRNGIVAGGVLQASEASRLAVVDEKGFSARLGAEFSICFCCPK